ncbi:MAG: hypothetical protein HY865_00905 [Chloroflexi bacterium]|nr:hypothetical protein [Chloroflexota bacterium]
MATNTKIKPSARKFNISEFAATVGAKISESIGDMIVTVIITGVMMIYIPQIHPVYVDSAVPGLYVACMIVQLLIRIVHRFDDSYTADEVGRQLARFEDEINSRIDAIIHNMIP